MKKGRFVEKSNDIEYYRSDIERIVRIFADRDIEISEEDAYFAWCAYSESMAAGWLILGTHDSDIFMDAKQYIEIEE